LNIATARTKTKRCPKCGRRRTRGRFPFSGDGQIPPNLHCKDCVPDTKGRTQKYARKWYSENKERLKRYSRNDHLKRMYGTTLEEYDAMESRQNGVCLICGMPPGAGRLCVDHDHDTGKIRGLLCHNCNAGIGLFREDINLIRKAVEYLGKENT
jgi:hypothetical protein